LNGQVTLDGYMNLGMRLGLPPFGIIGIPIEVNGPSETFKIKIGKYDKENLEETDEDFNDHQKFLEEEKLKQQTSLVK